MAQKSKTTVKQRKKYMLNIIMEVYVILYVWTLIVLLVSASEKACTDSECSSERDDGSCVKDGQCDDSEVAKRHKRDVSEAIVVQFHVRISQSVVQAFQKEQVLEELEEYLYNKDGVNPETSVSVNPKDMFNLRMEYVGNAGDRHTVSFVLQPNTENIGTIVETIKRLVNDDHEMKLFGVPFNMHTGSFSTDKTMWDWIKTVVSFELMMEYELLDQKGILEGKNQIATFLNDRFNISHRDIYDMTLTETKEENTVIEFSVPPVMPIDRQMLLKNVESFVVGPCNDTCKLPSGTNTKDECKSCGYVNLFGTNVYSNQQSFHSRQETWTGNEKKFKMVRIERKLCPDHQEFCTHGKSKYKCVGVGRCELNFYKTLYGSMEVYGNIRIFDVASLDKAIDSIEKSIIALYGFCSSAVHASLFDHGRIKTGVALTVDPSLGRKKAMDKFLHAIENNADIEVQGLTVSKVENSVSVTYLQPHKPIPRYIDNDCFGCTKKEIWCILPNISLCLPKLECLEKEAISTKFAPDTEIVRVSILMSNETDFVSITDELKDVMTQQIADQLYCSKELLKRVNMVTSEKDLFELGFDIVLRDNNTKLREIVLFLQRIVDREELHIETTKVSLKAISESLIYQQFISGYPKPEKDEIVSSHLGNAIIGGIIFALVITVITLFVTARRQSRDKHAHQTPAISAKQEKNYHNASIKRPEIRSLLRRK